MQTHPRLQELTLQSLPPPPPPQTPINLQAEPSGSEKRPEAKSFNESTKGQRPVTAHRRVRVCARAQSCTSARLKTRKKTRPETSTAADSRKMFLHPSSASWRRATGHHGPQACASLPFRGRWLQPPLPPPSSAPDRGGAQPSLGHAGTPAFPSAETCPPNTPRNAHPQDPREHCLSPLLASSPRLKYHFFREPFLDCPI